MRTAPLLALAALLACAGPDEGGRKLIRPGGEGDFGRDRGVADAGAPGSDQGGPDADVPDAEAPPEAPGVWYLLRHEAAAEGLRAQLSPPQAPDGAGLDATGDAPVLVRWAGPASPGEVALVALQQAGRRAAPLYDLAGRADAAAADASWLVAHHLQHPRALTVGGRPVLGVAPPADRAGLSALGARLATLPTQPYLVLEVGVDARPWPAADAILPRVAYGEPVDQQGEFADGGDEDQRTAARAAALAAGWAWLPRASPGGNRRGADPEAPVPEQPGALARSLVLARAARSAALPVVVVDGLGAWAEDRQVDPVAGADTDAPARLTGGRVLAAYGDARLALVARLLGPARGGPPADWALGPPTLLVRQGPMATLDEAGDTLTAAAPAPGATWLLDARPVRLPPGAQLVYDRDSADVAIDLRFADGTTLRDRLAPSDATGTVRVPLDAFAGWQVDAVVLEVAGAGAVTRPALVAP